MVMAEVPAVAVNSEELVAIEAAFADVEGTVLGIQDIIEIKGGYDPDAGGNNWKYTSRNTEKLAKYLSQEHKTTISVPVEASLSVPTVKAGYRITSPRGPYVSASVGPVTVTIDF
jgi:hypothetical protein